MSKIAKLKIWEKVLIFVAEMVIISVVYLIGLKMIYKVDVDALTEASYSLLYEFETNEEGKDTIVISGWTFFPKQPSKKGNVKLYLHNVTTNEIVKLRNNSFAIEELNLLFGDEYDYKHAGILAKVKSNQLDFDNNVYELVVALKKPRTVCKTGAYLTASGISYIHPDSVISLDVEETDLEEIVVNGRICVYKPEHDLYMYQYGNELYWISTKSDLWIEQLFYPIQEERVENFDGQWDYRSFSMQENRVINMNTGKYFVSKTSLPAEYDVWYGYTGGNNWSWSQYFRIGYSISDNKIFSDLK